MSTEMEQEGEGGVAAEAGPDHTRSTGPWGRAWVCTEVQ